MYLTCGVSVCTGVCVCYNAIARLRSVVLCCVVLCCVVLCCVVLCCVVLCCVMTETRCCYRQSIVCPLTQHQHQRQHQHQHQHQHPHPHQHPHQHPHPHPHAPHSGRQAAFVYPGGARETFKRTTDAKYELMWGDRIGYCSRVCVCACVRCTA